MYEAGPYSFRDPWSFAGRAVRNFGCIDECAWSLQAQLSNPYHKNWESN